MKILLVLLILFGSTTTSLAENLGVRGDVYPIQENDLHQEIMTKLAKMQKNGDLEKLQEKYAEEAFESIKRPKSNSEIIHTKTPRTFFYEPVATLKQPIQTLKAKLLAKGAKSYPLKVVKLTRALIFIDGDDERQVAWALDKTAEKHGKTKVILVSGSPIELINKHEMRFYFDFHSTITSKLGIKQVPAIVEQDDLRLRVEEVLL